MSLDTGNYAQSDNDLKEIYEFAIQLGQDAGKMLLQYVDQRCGILSARDQGQFDKSNAVDIVTQTDLGKHEL